MTAEQKLYIAVSALKQIKEFTDPQLGNRFINVVAGAALEDIGEIPLNLSPLQQHVYEQERKLIKEFGQ